MHKPRLLLVQIHQNMYTHLHLILCAILFHHINKYFVNVHGSCQVTFYRQGFKSKVFKTKYLIITSLRYSFNLMCIAFMTLVAITSLTLWYEQGMCLSTHDGTVVFNTTNMLSPFIIAGPSFGTPSIVNLYPIPILFNAAISSELLVENSTVSAAY